MYKTILFDLDDTLLRNEVESFLSAYFRALSPHLSHYFPNDDFYHIFTRATQDVLTAKPSSKTLLEIFVESFERNSPIDFAQIAGTLENFYKTDFRQVAGVTEIIPFAKEAVQTAHQKSNSLVLATIPVFPLQAILERVKWADIDIGLFKLVTHIENMHVSKPNPEYYEEIAEKLQTKPCECLMVGNDHVDDLAAKSTGMHTFLVTDFEKNQEKATYTPDHRGSMQELLHFLQAIQS